MKRAVVSGATGFIGYHLLNELLKHNVEVTALCLPGDPSIARLPGGVDIVYCGMDDYPTLASVYTGGAPDVFYHLAWEGATGQGRADETLQTKNAARTLEAIKAAKELGCAQFVAAGTVYENFCEQISAANAFRNASYYILSKRYARDMGRQLALRLGIKFCWCTFCHPAGRYMKPEQLLAYTVKGLLSGEPPIFGAAEEPFDIIAVEDLAAGLYLAGVKPPEGTDCYIGSGKPRILRDYLIETRAVLNSGTPIIFGGKPDDGMRFNIEWFNTSFEAKLSFGDIVRNVSDYFMETLNG
jgi:nucleoside-diphosphate-sugar epimerase